MLIWNVVGMALLVVLFLSDFGLLGFHTTPFPGGLILWGVAMIILCISDATKRIRKDLEK